MLSTTRFIGRRQRWSCLVGALGAIVGASACGSNVSEKPGAAPNVMDAAQAEPGPTDGGIVLDAGRDSSEDAAGDGGSSVDGSDSSPPPARGALDPAYARGGIAQGDVQSPTYAPNFAFDDQGHAFVLETLPAGGVRCTKYAPNGKKDGSFGQGGSADFLAPQQAVGRGVTVLSNGDVLLSAAVGSNAWVARVGSTGAPVASFAVGGVATYSSCKDLDSPVEISNGDIIFVANCSPTLSSPGWIVRFTATGKVDSSFGQSGKESLPPSTAGIPMFASAAGANLMLWNASGQVSMWRTSVDGVLDTMFGARPAYAHGNIDLANASVTALSGGAIAAVGDTGSAVSPRSSVVLLNKDGTSDVAFGTSGSLDVPGAKLVALAGEGNGAILAGGRSQSQPVVYAVTATGAVDTSFGASGSTSIPATGGGSGGYGEVAKMRRVGGAIMVGIRMYDSSGSGSLVHAVARLVD